MAALHRRALMSTVNYQEVVAKLMDRGLSMSSIDAVLQLPFELVDFDEKQAMAAGLVRANTRSSGLSAGDRACLALASTYTLPVLTADRAWAAIPGANVALNR